LVTASGRLSACCQTSDSGSGVSEPLQQPTGPGANQSIPAQGPEPWSGPMLAPVRRSEAPCLGTSTGCRLKCSRPGLGLDLSRRARYPQQAADILLSAERTDDHPW